MLTQLSVHHPPSAREEPLQTHACMLSSGILPHVTSTGWLASFLEDTQIIKEGRGI